MENRGNAGVDGRGIVKGDSGRGVQKAEGARERAGSDGRIIHNLPDRKKTSDQRGGA